MNYQSPYMNGAVAYQSAEVRAGFIRKVYQLFFTSMLITVGVGFVAAQSAAAILPMVFPLCLVGFVVGIGMSFARNVKGLNLALLFLYSAIQGAILGPVMLFLEAKAPGIASQAALLTIGVFGGLSIYVLVTGKDFNYLGGILCASILGLMIAGILLFFFQSPILSVLYSVAGILIFSGFILYDTSNIMNRQEPDGAVGGAIELYLDFIGMLWMILRLLRELNR